MKGPDGKWQGYGPGDSGAPVLAAAKKLHGKFSYGADVPLVDTVGVAFTAALVEFQLRTNIQRAREGVAALRVDGVLDYATQVALGITAPPVRVKPLLLTVHGTGQADPLGPGLPADVARAVLDRWDWWPVGNYPAAAFPMWPSIQAGVEELKALLRRAFAADPGRRIGLAGYSQGAIVVCQVFKHEFQNPQGEFHSKLANVVAGVTWGNPMRERGVQAWDGWKVVAPVDTCGILDDLMVDTPSFWREFAHKKDMYAACELDQNGDNKRAVCKIVMGHDVFKGANNIIEQICEVLAKPVEFVIPLFRSLVDAGMFFAAGLDSPHGYVPDVAIEYLRGF